MRILLSPTEERMGRTHGKALIIVSVSATIIGLAVSLQPFAFAQVNSKEHRLLEPTQVRPSSDLKTGSPLAKKPHKLIRRPATAPTAAQQTISASDHMPPTNTAKIPATPTVPSQDGAPAQNQSKDSFSNKATTPPAFAAPLPSPLVGLTATGTGTPRTAFSLAGSAAPSTRTAAAAPASSAPAPPPSMRRLFTEIPSTAQIMAYEDPAPTVTSLTILRNPTAMSFSAIQNGATPVIQTLTLSNGGTGTLAWTAASNNAWLTLNGTTSVAGLNLGTLAVAVNPSGLAIGSHSGIITIVAPGSTNSPQTVTVTFDITDAPTPTIGLSATSLSFFSAQGGSNPAAQTISISNSGSGTLTWAATENASWLSLSPASGTGTGTLSVSVATAGLTAGTYSGMITLSATGATSVTVPVTFTVTAAPSLTISPSSLSFTATQGSSNPANQTFTISSNGDWNASDNASWLSITPNSGSGNGTVTVSVNSSTATLGNNSATITITGSGQIRTVAVTLTLNAPATSSATLQWNANGETDLAGYKVYRATSSGGYVSGPIATLPPNVTSYQVVGLQLGTTYYFVITAYDSAGNESQYSNEVSKSAF